MFSRLVTLALLCLAVRAEPPARWTVARSPHFTVYSQAGDDSARSALLWFESLRAFFLSHTDFAVDDRNQVFIIGFRSVRDYDPYRLQETSDAFYVGEEGRDYIVLPSLSYANYALATHEYAHLAFHSAGLNLPFWFGEGLAEVLSTLHIGPRESYFGGDLPARSQLLARETWLPLSTLFAEPHGSTRSESRAQAGLFYSQSWLLVDMLVRSPEYAPAFPAVFKSLAAGTSGEQALTATYRKPLDVITADLRHWATTRSTAPISLSGVAIGDISINVAEAPQSAPRALIAQILLASGELGRAKSLYADLEHDDLTNGDASAALASIALVERDPARAHAEWQRAMKAGITDAALCLRYAVGADAAGIDPAQIREALRQAVTLDPTLDDCRYRLALSEMSAGHLEEAIAQLRAMRNVAPQRTFAYWIAMASALQDLDRREETITAARHALECATNSDQRVLARQMIFVAQTDLNVQFTRDAKGNEEIQTTRIPHNAKYWNPFIEPGDNIAHAEGTLARVDCAGMLKGIVVTTRQGALNLKVVDPHRVLMTNAPNELTCGDQNSMHVRVEYVTPSDVLKGLEVVPEAGSLK